jgi:ElaB/YqjD/DUF883 family membrane-anchored ribosome-binding protein
MNQTNYPAAGSNADGKQAGTVDQLSNNAHRVVDRAASAARPAVDSVASGAHQVIEKVAGAAHSAATGIEHKGEQLHDVQQRFSDSVRRYVHEQPMASLGMAVGAGFILSWLIRAR